MVPLSYNARSIWVRKATAISAALGIALVVFVLSSSLMLSRGVQRTMKSSGSANNAIVLRKGTSVELVSAFDSQLVNLVLSCPGVRAGPDRQPLGAGEVVLVVALERARAVGQLANVTVRGIPAGAMALRRAARVIKGRMAKPGTDEIMIGKGLLGQYAGLGLGQHFELKTNRPVSVVGVFEADGSAFESEIWADIDVVRNAFGREGLVSSVTVALESPEKLEAFVLAVENDKRMSLEVVREDRYFEKQAEGTSTVVRVIGTTIVFFLSLGAIAGAVITMNVAVSSRRREIGTLRALGFSRFAVLTSFLTESLVLALSGAALGAVASMSMGLLEISLTNQDTWSRVNFSFTPSVGLIAEAVLVGGIMGILGGFLPAARAAGTSPIEAMRD